MARRSPAQRDTREKILAAALELFGSTGYAAASPEDIATAAGVTKGAFYYYFEDKEDLARDLHRQIWERLKQQSVAAFDPAADTVANLQRAFLAYLHGLDRLGDARFFLRESWHIGRNEPDSDEALLLLKGLLDEGVRKGDLLDLDTTVMARVLLGAFSEATLHVLSGGDDEQTHAVLGHVLRALTPAKTTVRK